MYLDLTKVYEANPVGRLETPRGNGVLKLPVFRFRTVALEVSKFL
jgi:hypothetical protein